MKEPTLVLSIKDREAVAKFANQPPHALIITAEYGIDVWSVAQKIAHATPSDILILEPIPPSRNIAVEQIRSLIASLRTHAARRRIVIIRPAETMTEAAQNALLKTLEEPNINTHFLLLTENEAQLLDTIRSRCQLLQLHKTSAKQDADLLAKKPLSDGEKQQILFLAAGRPLLIQQLADNPKLFNEHKALAVDAKQIITNHNDYQSLLAINRYLGDRHKAIQLTDVIINMLRFQAYSHGLTDSLTSTLTRTINAANALRANGNIRLALLQIVVQ